MTDRGRAIKLAASINQYKKYEMMTQGESKMNTVQVRAPCFACRSGARMLVVGTCAMFAAVTASQAGEIDGDVHPLASPVSLSVPGSQPVAAYTVTLTNTASSPISNGRLVATTTSRAAFPGPKRRSSP